MHLTEEWMNSQFSRPKDDKWYKQVCLFSWHSKNFGETAQCIHITSQHQDLFPLGLLFYMLGNQIHDCRLVHQGKLHWLCFGISTCIQVGGVACSLHHKQTQFFQWGLNVIFDKADTLREFSFWFQNYCHTWLIYPLGGKVLLRLKHLQLRN